MTKLIEYIKIWKVYIIAVVVFCFVWFCISTEISYQNKPKPIPQYQIGELVTLILGGHEGMVMKTKCLPGAEKCKYYIHAPGATFEWWDYNDFEIKPKGL